MFSPGACSSVLCHWLVRFCLVALACSGVCAQTTTLLSSQGPEKRLALVIGNSSYAASPLPNPVNDMRAMTAALRAANFEVMFAENVPRRQLLALVNEFTRRLSVQGGVGLFYFAGHGLQIKGRNYLVPVDAQVTSEDEAAYDSMEADFVLQKMGDAKNRMNIIILDACRNNPFVRARSTGGGLAQMDAPVGSLIAYATAPGSVASDGAGSNGLYTQHLVTAIMQRGLRVEEVFKQVRSNVRRDSQGRQIPWENTALEGEFFFFPESVQGAPQANPHAVSSPGPAVLEMGGGEQTAWDAARLGGLADVEQFLRQYPNGRHGPAARERLAALVATQRASVATLAAVTPAAADPPPAAPPAAGPSGRISLQALAAMVQAPIAAAVPAPAAGSPAWTYAISGGGAATEEIRMQSLQAGWQRFSNGTEIHQDGRVRAIRLGRHLVQAVNDGNFMRLPARAGQGGAHTVQVVDPQGRVANARMIWRTEAAGDLVKLLVTVDGVSFVLRYEALFSANQLFPARYESETRNRLAAGPVQVLTARLQP